MQFEIALSDTLSIVATKDGYIDFNPDATMTEAEGFANLAAGVKYLFPRDTDKSLAMSTTVTVELPTGNRGRRLRKCILNTLKGYEDIEVSSSPATRTTSWTIASRSTACSNSKHVYNKPRFNITPQYPRRGVFRA